MPARDSYPRWRTWPGPAVTAAAATSVHGCKRAAIAAAAHGDIMSSLATQAGVRRARFLCRHCTASNSAGQLPPLGRAFQPTCVLPGGARDIGGDDRGGGPAKATPGPPWWSWDRHARRLPARHVAALRALAPR